MLLALQLCGCASLLERAESIPITENAEATELTNEAPGLSSSTDSVTVPDRPQAGERPAQRILARPIRTRITHDRQFPAPIRVVQAPNAETTFSPAEPRYLLTAGGQPGGPIEPADLVSSPDAYPDEYLFDGGDRGLPVHYDQFNRKGLDTEDTVAEYVDHLGERHVQPTNRVAIYAPRFGALRTVSRTEEGSTVMKLAGAHDSMQGFGLRNRTVPTHHRQSHGLDTIRVRSRAGGLDTKRRQRGVDQAAGAASHEKLLNAYQDLAFVRTGRFRQADEARLAGGIQAALVWRQDQGPVITGTLSSGQEVYGSFRPEEYVGREDERKTKGRLRIVKLADKKTAAPGDLLTFTIRYDNLGDRELYHIRIIDNLSPRLELVEDSPSSDRDGRLVVDDNEEGSLVLRFELDGPLPGHQGGVITFQVRVR